MRLTELQWIFGSRTRHAFLFGCNIFQRNGVFDAQRQCAYRERFKAVLNAEIFALQLKRITDCIEHLSGQIEMWDVVNEQSQSVSRAISTRGLGHNIV